MGQPIKTTSLCYPLTGLCHIFTGSLPWTLPYFYNVLRGLLFLFLFKKVTCPQCPEPKLKRKKTSREYHLLSTMNFLSKVMHSFMFEFRKMLGKKMWLKIGSNIYGALHCPFMATINRLGRTFTICSCLIFGHFLGRTRVSI